MIVAISNAIDAITNHKQMGKLTTDEKNSILAPVVSNVQMSLFSIFRKANRRKMQWMDSPNYGDEAAYLKQAIEYYIKEADVVLTDSKVTLSSAIPDFLYINGIFTDQTHAEKTDLDVFNRLNRLPDLRPTTCLPIYTLNDDVLKLSPSLTKVSVVYYRKAKTPKLTTTMLFEKEVYDTDAPDYQDIDLHAGMMQAVLVEVMAYFGVNLNDQFALELATQLKQDEQIKQQ